MLESGKAEHLDMDERAPKEPLFSFSWRDQATLISLQSLLLAPSSPSLTFGFPKTHQISLLGFGCEPPEEGGREALA